MPEIDKTDLPGIGTRYDVTLESGERMGVVVHRGGSAKELLLYDPDDPDSCQATIRLSEADIQQLLALLQQRAPHAAWVTRPSPPRAARSRPSCSWSWAASSPCWRSPAGP